MAAKKIRLPLLVLLAIVTTFALLIPVVSEASPTCGYTAGHFSNTDNISGWQSNNCGTPVICTIGHQHFEWDCVYDTCCSGPTHVTNVVADPPVMCFCDGYTSAKCC
jgi:hypothetical protein